ncbi:MAG: D-glycero-beta-D-manno-heptose 1-phosphate adenylyltransferase [Ignavibacteria bacterium]
MIVTKEKFIPIRNKLKQEKQTLVFTNGCFDIIHRGHIEYLNEAKKLGDFLLVAVNSDRSVKKIKGDNRPINSQQDRAVVLDNLKPVDGVIIFDEETPYELIKLFLPDVLVKGGDWKVEDIVGSDIVLSHGGRVISLSFLENYSTTAIIKKITG